MSTDRIITVRPKETFISKQQLPNFEGISAQSAGTKHLCMHLVVIPPGGKATAHYHDGFETTIYIIKGRAETKYGAGDFLFIPPNLPHQPINLSETEEVLAVVARNDPNEQESIVIYNS
jgi:uncharacterized RmlC-like cupin family protein